MAPEPGQCGAVFSLQTENRPHHVDEIFDLAGRAAPSVLWKLRRRAGCSSSACVRLSWMVSHQGSRTIEAPGAHDRRMALEISRQRARVSKAAEALGSRTVEARPDKRVWRQNADRGPDRSPRSLSWMRCPATREALPLQIVIDRRFDSLAIGGEICRALLKQPWLDRQGRPSARCRWPTAARGCGRQCRSVGDKAASACRAGVPRGRHAQPKLRICWNQDHSATPV
jgi:hypothetical protein